ncbi:MAG TPA: 50S ribosomal protein L15e [Candidatus Acidoferrales bacterium]|nr:50S ribosomal protein L15e [Candidatus Acidoferrales bacterium]
MGSNKYLTQTWYGREKNDLQTYMRQLAIRWRREPTVHRVEHPTRLDRARALGFKAKQGYVVVRVRIRKGGARKPRPRSGRRQRAMGVNKFTRGISLKNIAEEKARKRYPNLLVLNSYYVWEDGTHHWYETILRDPHNPASQM